jgi:hypothetical protein
LILTNFERNWNTGFPLEFKTGRSDADISFSKCQKPQRGFDA